MTADPQPRWVAPTTLSPRLLCDAVRRSVDVPVSARGFMASRYPRTYAADFVRLFPGGVPGLVWETLVRRCLAAWVWAGVPETQLLGEGRRLLSPQSRVEAGRVLAVWALVEHCSLADVERVAADAFCELTGLSVDRPDPTPVMAEPDPGPPSWSGYPGPVTTFSNGATFVTFDYPWGSAPPTG